MKKQHIHQSEQKNNKFPFNAIKIAMFYAIVFVLLAITVYLAWVNHSNFEDAMITQAHNQLFLIAKSQAQSIEEHMGDIYEELSITSQQPAVHDFLKQKTQRSSTAARESLLSAAYKDIQKLTDSLCLLNAEGIVVDAMPVGIISVGDDLSSLAEIKSITMQPQAVFSNVFKLTNGKLAIAYTYPVIDQGRFIGSLRTVIVLERIQRLVDHINRIGKIKALVVGSGQTLIVYPDSQYVGKNFTSVIKERAFRSGSFDPAMLAEKMSKGEEGKGVVYCFFDQVAHIEKNLIAFIPIHLGKEVWSIAAFMPYQEIAGPIHRNVLDNILFVGLILLIFVIVGTVIYIMQQKKVKLEVETLALNIINRQLHSDISERKRIEEEFYKSFGRKPRK
ncbi:MAG: cache domain-containing protein [Candidatus Omnitrophota bacterium]